MEQVNHYYPGLFGEGTATSSQPYKYNGKELDRMHGLDWYDYEAIVATPTADSMAETFYSLSPYNNYVIAEVNHDNNDVQIEVFSYDDFPIAFSLDKFIEILKESEHSQIPTLNGQFKKLFRTIVAGYLQILL